MFSMKVADRFKLIFGNRAKEVKIKLLYQKEAWAYVMSIEAAHKTAAKSKLTFP